MPTPIKGYRDVSGKKIPGTTTIIGRFKDSGALIRWAWQRGKEFPDEDLYASRDEAGAIGTVAHAMVEASIKGLNPEGVGGLAMLNDEGRERARNAFKTYQQWASMSKLEILEQEIPLVSERYKFGGTPDAIGKVNGQLCLVDWKTSNGVYGDYLLQLAAYKQLWEENNPDRPLVGGFHLCRFSKDYGDFSHHFYTELESAWAMFWRLREAYEFDKELKKRAA